MLRSLFQSQANAAKDKALGNIQNVSGKTYFKYLLVFSLLLVIFSAASFFYDGNVLKLFIGFQLYSIFLGVIHIWQMGKKFGWRNKYSFIEKLEITIVIILVSFILSGIILYFLPLKAFFYLFPTAILFFAFPLLAISVFDFAMAIPQEEYKKWIYPIKMEIPDMDKIDFQNSYVLTFEVYKKDNERLPTFMKFKAPLTSISFGDLFYMYLYEYNERNREGQIEVFDRNQVSYSWLFYVKPKHWWNSKVMVDPSLTIRENKIKENGIIIPYRV